MVPPLNRNRQRNSISMSIVKNFKKTSLAISPLILTTAAFLTALLTIYVPLQNLLKISMSLKKILIPQVLFLTKIENFHLSPLKRITLKNISQTAPLRQIKNLKTLPYLLSKPVTLHLLGLVACIPIFSQITFLIISPAFYLDINIAKTFSFSSTLMPKIFSQINLSVHPLPKNQKQILLALSTLVTPLMTVNTRVQNK